MGAQRAARRPYTKDDDDFISLHFGDWSNRQIAAELGRTESGVRYRAKKLGLVSNVEPVPKVPEREDGESTDGRLSRLLKLREIMEEAIAADEVPMMQRPAYYREYRALLKEIDELEGGGDGERDEEENESPFAKAIAMLADQQRQLLEQAANS